MSEKTKRIDRASSYPPIYLQIFMRVAQTGKELVINNLAENRQTAYVSLRARMSAFRKAYADEAEASTGPNAEGMRAIAGELYAVTLCNPEQIDGKWSLVMRPKGYKFIETLEDALRQHDEQMDLPPQDILPSSTLAISNPGRSLIGAGSGSAALAALYSTDPEEDPTP